MKTNQPATTPPAETEVKPIQVEIVQTTVQTAEQSNRETKAVRKSIEQLIKEGNLKQALDDFEEFLSRCNSDEITSELKLRQGNLSNLDSLDRIGTIGSSEASLDRNVLRFGFLGQLAKFRKEVLGKYFDINGEAEFLAKITSRDQVIHEILDIRLLPKQYQRDENWQKVEGNSSIIYRLLNLDTKRHAIAMVIKTPEIEENLKEEINRLTDLRHRNIIKLLDYQVTNFPFFVITEYVYGENLPDALNIVGPRTVAQAADWLYQLTDALDYLRHKRILHTNVRPSKIYIDDEWQIMVSPFDLVKAPSGASAKKKPSDLEQPNFNPGERTFNRYRDVCQYGSPELFERDGECINDAHQMCISDMYSIGLVGYKILTGDDLFGGETLFEILESRRRYDEDETYRAQKLAKLPQDELSEIVKKLLEKEKSQREKHYKNLRTLIHAINPLTMAERYDASEVQKSYRRCLASNREFIKDFYSSFLKNSPHKGDFDDIKQKRQSAMLQMAVDVLLDLDKKEKYLAKLVNPDGKHGKYGETDFEAFLDNLIKTVSKFDHEWDKDIEAAWLKIKKNVLQSIHKTREIKKEEKPGKENVSR